MIITKTVIKVFKFYFFKTWGYFVSLTVDFFTTLSNISFVPITLIYKSTNWPVDVRYISNKEERQAILTKKKEIRLKRKNRKKAILLNIA